MNFTFRQIFIEAIIISSLIIIIFFCHHSQKSSSPILFEKNDVFLSEEKDSREVIFEIVRLREIIKEMVLKLSFFLVVIVALWAFLEFGILIFKILKINIFNLLIDFFNSIVEYIVKYVVYFLKLLFLIFLGS